jgi:hypothetical protein
LYSTAGICQNLPKSGAYIYYYYSNFTPLKQFF